MAQYDADKIIQLLRLCSWKGQTEMSHTGLMDLTSKLGALPDNDEQVPNEKYLVDLLDDAQKAQKHDKIVIKRKSYIDLLLKYGDFNSWKEWKDTFYASAEYIQKELKELPDLGEIKVAIWNTGILTKQFNPLLEIVKTSFKYPVNQLTCPEEAPANYASSLLSQLKEYAFIVWLIPVGWKDQPKQMSEPTWKELMETGRIIPLWVNPDDCRTTNKPFIPELDKTPVLSNIRDLYASLLYLEEKINLFLQPEPEINEEVSVPNRSGIQFNDNSFGNFNKGNVHQTIQHISGGGNSFHS